MTALATGTLVDGRYRLVMRLGEGTFGEVWRADDTRLSGRAVAMKVLKAELHSLPEVVERFDNEAKALAALAHPNVVQISDRGEWDGRSYLVMELVEGEPLDAWLDAYRAGRQMPDLDAVRDIFDQVCAGVEAAHDARAPGAIVHRDIKSGNIMLAKGKRNRWVAKVLDFGIARLGMRQRTQSGISMGTPLFMSPEQGLVQPSDLGTWSDVFSLGVLLVELLSLQETAPGDKCWWVAALSPDSIGGILRTLRAGVPEGIWAVAEKALEREPRDRYQDAGQLREALQAAWARADSELAATAPGVTQPLSPLFDVVEVPAGAFWMGSRDGDPQALDNEKPCHEREVGALWIGKTVVTQAQYREVFGESRGKPLGVDLPVTHVTWFDAVKFCNVLSRREGYACAYEIDGSSVTWREEADGYRLPTEAEWEYAARAGTETAFSFGDDEADLDEYAWSFKNSGGELRPVAQRKPNPWGLHDMHGNVWEWCWDWFGPYPAAPPSGSLRVIRGGTFFSAPRFLRCGVRSWSEPDSPREYIGFRCVRSARRGR